MKGLPLICFIMLLARAPGFAQARQTDIYTDFVLYGQRAQLGKDLRERVTGKPFSGPLDGDTEFKYELACGAVSQFLFDSPVVAEGMAKLFAGYDSLSFSTRRAFLEAVYAAFPSAYADRVQAILEKESDPRLFSLCAVYLYRRDTTVASCNALTIRMVEKFPGYDSVVLLRELAQYLNGHTRLKKGRRPAIEDLFAYRAVSGQRTIFSFQRWDRDYPGMAIVQNADGHFARGADGRLLVFEQLARSGSDLPYFLTNGSTPQGVYSIQGLGVSRNHFIGPTPNIQLLMPNEGKWADYFQEGQDTAGIAGTGSGSAGVGGNAGGKGVSGVSGRTDFPAGDSLARYLALLPPSWRGYAPMKEAWSAGMAGRTEIIAHGTTLDPEYFSKRAFYPLTPTEGCLCARELWNPTTGHLLVSEQFGLASAYEAGGGTAGNGGGYLYVISMDDQRKPVSRAEVERWVRGYEKR